MLWLQPYGKFISAEKESKRFKKIRDFQSFPKNDSERIPKIILIYNNNIIKDSKRIPRLFKTFRKIPRDSGRSQRFLKILDVSRFLEIPENS